MSEYLKDSTKANGWTVVSYGSRGRKHRPEDGAPMTADAMSAEDDGMSEGEEGPESVVGSIRSRL
jgi:hypothetical protein